MCPKICVSFSDSTAHNMQRNHWQRLQPWHKRLVMDTLLSMVDFAASYNSDANLRARMQQVSGDRYTSNTWGNGVPAYRVICKVSKSISRFVGQIMSLRAHA